MEFKNPFARRKKTQPNNTPVSAGVQAKANTQNNTPAKAPAQNSTSADLLSAFEDYVNSQDLLAFTGYFTDKYFNIECIHIDNDTIIGQGDNDKNGLFYGINFTIYGSTPFKFYQSKHPIEYATLERLYKVCDEKLKNAEPIRQRKEQEAKKRLEQNELNESVLSILKTTANLSGNQALISEQAKDYTRKDLIDACAELVKSADSLRFREHGVDPNGFLGAEILAKYQAFIIFHKWEPDDPTNDFYTIKVSDTNKEYTFPKSQKLEALLNTCVQNIEPSRKREQEKAARKAAEEYQKALTERTAWFKKRTLDNQKS